MKNKRMCIICRKKFDKNELTKISLYNDKLLVNSSNGRGAYFCECCNKNDLFNKKLLNKAFKTKISLEMYDLLKKELYID